MGVQRTDKIPPPKKNKAGEFILNYFKTYYKAATIDSVVLT